jgi:hypothetical protein
LLSAALVILNNYLPSVLENLAKPLLLWRKKGCLLAIPVALHPKSLLLVTGFYTTQNLANPLTNQYASGRANWDM